MNRRKRVVERAKEAEKKNSLVETDLKVKKSSYGESFTIIQLDEILTD